MYGLAFLFGVVVVAVIIKSLADVVKNETRGGLEFKKKWKNRF